MQAAIREFAVALAKFFIGLFVREKVVTVPLPPPTPEIIHAPEPVFTPTPIPPPPPAIAAALKTAATAISQSAWWHGRYTLTQAWGCTDLALEGHNPFHPECKYFHEGVDYALPMRTPIYAGYEIYVEGKDVPGYLGANALHLCVGPGRTCDHDIWLYHMDQVLLALGRIYPKGTLIGYSGARGQVTGPHIHFEVRPHGAAYRHSMNPSAWVTGRYYEG